VPECLSRDHAHRAASREPRARPAPSMPHGPSCPPPLSAPARQPQHRLSGRATHPAHTAVPRGPRGRLSRQAMASGPDNAAASASRRPAPLHLPLLLSRAQPLSGPKSSGKPGRCTGSGLLLLAPRRRDATLSVQDVVELLAWSGRGGEGEAGDGTGQVGAGAAGRLGLQDAVSRRHRQQCSVPGTASAARHHHQGRRRSGPSRTLVGDGVLVREVDMVGCGWTRLERGRESGGHRAASARRWVGATGAALTHSVARQQHAPLCSPSPPRPVPSTRRVVLYAGGPEDGPLPLRPLGLDLFARLVLENGAAWYLREAG
jgi:hypothetical protein